MAVTAPGERLCKKGREGLVACHIPASSSAPAQGWLCCVLGYDRVGSHRQGFCDGLWAQWAHLVFTSFRFFHHCSLSLQTRCKGHLVPVYCAGSLFPNHGQWQKALQWMGHTSDGQVASSHMSVPGTEVLSWSKAACGVWESDLVSVQRYWNGHGASSTWAVLSLRRGLMPEEGHREALTGLGTPSASSALTSLVVKMPLSLQDSYH